MSARTTAQKLRANLRLDRLIKSRRMRGAFNKMKKRKIRKPLALKVHNFVERKRSSLHSLNSGTLDANGNFITTNTFSFQLSDIPQVANYAALFEYYRIDKVIVEFKYKTAGIYANTTGGATPASPSINEINPTLIFKVDHNDVVGDSFNILMESSRTKEKQLTNDKPNFSIAIKPAIQSEAYKSAIASTYIPKWRQWLTTDDPTVPHYGLKLQVQCPAPSGAIDFGSLQITMKYYFSVKCNE